MNLSDLAGRLGCTLRGSGSVEVTRVKGLDEAGPGDLTFVANPKYLGKLGATRASAVILAPEVECPLPSLLTPEPYLAFARAVALLHPSPPLEAGVHPQACVDPTATIGEGAHVAAFAFVGPRVRVGARTVVRPHVALYEDVEVGDDCVLHSGVQVREGCRLGHRVVVHNGSVIGADGFGFAKDAEGRYLKIPQVGIVVIEDDVEIGALTAIDRAALGETRIGRRTKLDNLVQIGHSVTIGADSIVAAQVGIAGSTKIGDRVTLAGQVGIVGHISIGDGTIATAKTGIGHSIPAGSIVSGAPEMENRAWLKSTLVFAKLPELQKRVRELERALAEAKKR
ncbi:MAG TPA: UDP-3-O-(3-hydroxymyristoyl)glucosamine N-acyltransferase [Vicinamibacteria bacterium]|nr:UDP-3-O-(3-hydroxymyristoyl)glucosamine N-acyltransferase [Vicinamibacteria bacterium]